MDETFESEQKCKGLLQDGKRLFDLELYSEAIICFNDALDDLTTDESLIIKNLMYKGRCFKKLKNHKDALFCFEKVLGYMSNHEFALRMRGICLFELKDFKNAIECFTRAQNVNHKEPAYWWWKSNCYDKLGDFDRMGECNNKYFDLYFKNPDDHKPEVTMDDKYDNLFANSNAKKLSDDEISKIEFFEDFVEPFEDE